VEAALVGAFESETYGLTTLPATRMVVVKPYWWTFLKEVGMHIVETQELVPSCHRPEIVETSELQPTCHS